MQYAVELSPTQSSRTVEQAVRNQVTTLIEPRIWMDAEGIKGRLVEADAAVIRVAIIEEPVTSLAILIGMYCDVTIQLGRDRYLCDSYVVNAEDKGGTWLVELARPERLQVQQRRRYWRVALAEPSDVFLRVGDGNKKVQGRGRMYNISGEGLACLVDHETEAALAVGDTLSVSFQLPDSERLFELTAVLCSKTPAAEPGQSIVGMQFLQPASSGIEGPAKDLHALLLSRYGSGVAEPVLVSSGKGAGK